MDSDTSSDDERECYPRPKNAFDLLMAPPSKKAKADKVDPIMIAVIYIRWLKWIDPSEPLYMCPYVGQAVRAGLTAELVAVARWKEENRDAMRESKRVGLLHALKVHGPEAFNDQVVEWKQGPRSEVQKWANEREIALIAEHGGPLRDPSVRCKQTLNLDHGGKFGMHFDAMDALRTIAWLTFQDEMDEYVDCYGTALVPRFHVMSSGCKLGRQLNNVRQGMLWRGHPDETKRVEWLESLPGWVWNVRESDEWVEGCSERTMATWANLTGEARADWCHNISEAQKKAQSRPEVKAKHSKCATAQRANETPEQRAEHNRKISETRSTPEAKAAQSERSKAMWANATHEKHAELCQKFSEAHNRPEVKTATSKRKKKEWANMDDATRAEVCRKMSESHSTPEAKTATSERKKKEWANMDDATRAEKLRKMSEGRDIATAVRRAAAMASLSESDRKKKQAKYDRSDRSVAKQRGKANALLKLAAYAEKGYQWCYRNLTQATKDGVVFSQDEHGVWNARACGDQGSSAGAGSSAEHARTVAVLEEAAEAPEEPDTGLEVAAV